MPRNMEATTGLEASTRLAWTRLACRPHAMSTNLEASTCLRLTKPRHAWSPRLTWRPRHAWASMEAVSTCLEANRTVRPRKQRRAPKARPHGQAAQTMPSTQSATARPGRANIAQAPKARPHGQAAQATPCTQSATRKWWAAKRTFGKTIQTRSPPQNRTMEIHPATNSSCQVAQHRYGAVHASPQIWTCLCLPTDMGLSMPPHS